MFNKIIGSSGETKESLKKERKELTEQLSIERSKVVDLEKKYKEIENSYNQIQQELKQSQAETKEVLAKCEGMAVRTSAIVQERDKLKEKVKELEKASASSSSSSMQKISEEDKTESLRSSLSKKSAIHTSDNRKQKRMSDRPSVDFSHTYQVFEIMENDDDDEDDSKSKDEHNQTDLRGSQSALTHSELRGSVSGDGSSMKWESSSKNFPHVTVITDLDGTLLPAPLKIDGVLVHPKLSDGDAHAPLVKLLENGGAVVGVTGGKLGLQKERFWDELPLAARIEGRVLLFCETGMVLYKSDDEGNPVEDESYGPFPGNTKRYIEKNVVDDIVKSIQGGMKQWFTDLKNDPSLIDEKHWLHAKCDQWSHEDCPVTNDTHITPRIELRGTEETGIFGMVIAGVPVEYGDKYLSSAIQPFSEQVDGIPTGRLCYDIVVPGLNKHLVLMYLLRCGLIAKGAAVAIADSPGGNDEGLTVQHETGIPFISVCNDIDAVPLRLRDCHVGGNHKGSGAFFHHLVKADEDRSLTAEMDDLVTKKVARLSSRARKDMESKEERKDDKSKEDMNK